MSTFGTMKDRLSLISAGHKTESEIGDLINRVHQEECENYDWHDRFKKDLIASVAVKTDGTISLAQDSAAVIGSSTAFASTDVGSYFRPGSDEVLIEISSFTSTVAITLATSWPGSALSGSSYELFPLFYSLPSDCYEVLNISRQGVPVIKKSRTEFHIWDPSRQSSASTSLFWAPAGVDSSGYMRVEFWPHNTDAVLYDLEYKAGHTDMTEDNDRPLVPASVVENKALHDVCMAEFLRTGDDRWKKTADVFYSRYLKELEEAKKTDARRFGLISQIRDDLTAQPFDHDFMAKHDIIG